MYPSSRHLRTVFVALTLGILVTLLLYSSPQALSSANSLRYEALSPNEAIARRTPKSCQPHHHVMFLKTHKCASSTVQNIFLRYGYRHNLTFALPDVGNYLGNPDYFKVEFIPSDLLPESGNVDIFPVHTRLNAPEHSRILHNDTRWITIVRDPSALYESLFNFYHLNRIYRGLQLSDFNKVPVSFLTELPRYGGKFGRNQMLFDLGYSENITVNELRSAIEDLDNLFDIVMIAEFIDESLILLRYNLCWSLDDIVYFVKNARRQEMKPTLGPDTLATLRELNSADALLYDHFVSKHHRQVLKFGKERMAREVAALRALREQYFKNCGMHEVKGQDSKLQFKEYSGQVNTYVTANNASQICLMLSLPELSLVDAIRLKQRQKLNPR